MEMGIWAKDGDPSRQLLYLIKCREWTAAQNLLNSDHHFDFTLTDKVCFKL